MKQDLRQWIAIHASDVTPNGEEKKKVQQVAQLMLSRCKVAAERLNEKVTIILGGSYAHDTWLPGKGDIDVFLAFDKAVGKDGLSVKGLKIAHEALAGYDVVTRYAEHPYLEGFVEGVRVNVVPCLNVKKGEWISAADRSPHHTEYMSAKLNEGMKLQVRLLKRLMQTQRLYGAEIKVRGFSGYVCEVLIAKYGNLEELLKAASSWRNDTVISLEEYRQNVEGFAILDPVDTNRNLARAIAPWKVAEFIFLSRIILKGTKCDPFLQPLLDYPEPNDLSDLLENVFVLYFTHRKENEDTIWGELARSSQAIVRHLTQEGFEVLNHTYSSDLHSSAICLLLAGERIARLRSRTGPEVYRDKETDTFLKSSKTLTWFFSDDFRSRRIERSSFPDILHLIEFYMERPIERIGFSKGIAEGAKKSWKMMNGKEAMLTSDEVVKDAVRRVFGYSPAIDSC
ncbi:MAG: CCA tRNA nucleotidyltransferase [Conexivisphaerales archaeon]